ncbi:MAG: hypothetical protein JNK04_03440 [Myxococcales bacterium]|nr:hypothetical protein [Myxococcales bacterium]
MGASLELAIPAIGGSGGHGPYARYYDERKDLRVEAPPGLGIVANGASVIVTCRESGVFPVTATAVGADRKPVVDSYDVECVMPTRIEAETDTSVTYLANASEVVARVSWYGTRSDGREARLWGSLPIAISGDETGVVAGGPSSRDSISIRPTRAMARSVRIASGGLTADVPVRAIDRGWKLKLKIVKPASGIRLAVIASAVDERGAPIAITDCVLTGSPVGVASSPAARFRACSASRLVPRSRAEGGLLRADWTADRVCATVLGQKACEEVPQ